MIDRAPETTKFFLKSVIYLTKLDYGEDIDIFNDIPNLIIRMKLLAKFSYLKEVIESEYKFPQLNSTDFFKTRALYTSKTRQFSI